MKNLVSENVHNCDLPTLQQVLGGQTLPAMEHSVAVDLNISCRLSVQWDSRPTPIALSVDRLHVASMPIRKRAGNLNRDTVSFWLRSLHRVPTPSKAPQILPRPRSTRTQSKLHVLKFPANPRQKSRAFSSLRISGWMIQRTSYLSLC